MNRVALTAFAILVVVVAVVSSSAAPADPSASTDDIKAAYEKGDYNETLKLIGRVLALKGKAAEGVDRYELLMLRAESHLKLKKQTDAIKALEDAAKVAKAAKDDKQQADARALIALIKRSKNLQFTPKVPIGKDADKKASGPIDISDSKERKDALEALYNEEKAAAKPKVQAAQKGKTLPPVATALKAVVGLKDLELAAKGNDSETSETVKDLVDRAHKLMAKSLDDMTKRVTRISDRANEQIQYQVNFGGVNETRIKRRGLDKGDLQDLKDIEETSKKIIDSCKGLAEGFAEDAEPFEDLEDLAKDTAQRAHDVRSDNYSQAAR